METFTGSFHSFWEQADGQRYFFDVPALIDLAAGNDAAVRYDVTLLDSGAKQTRHATVNALDVLTAQAHLVRGRVAIELPNGGWMNAIPGKIAVLSENDRIQVGLQLQYSDLTRAIGISRQYPVIRTVVPLSRVHLPAVGDPLGLPLMDQQLLLGSVVKEWDATPIVVLGKRIARMGPAYFVMEKRDLVDPAIRLARIYLVPVEWVRAAPDVEEYDRLLEASLISGAGKRDANYTAFRQEGLAPWTHLTYYFEKDPDRFETDSERIERRATALLKWLNGMPQPDEGQSLVEKQRTCADYLYLPEGK